jgi:hypothetical protein
MVGGLLHTVPSLAATFDGPIRDAGVRPIHVADGWLLETVLREGVTDAVRDTVIAHARHLASMGARAVLVTCSSIGEVAASIGEEARVPVLRVDAAMADEAVRIASGTGGRIAVLATLATTLGPTGRLVRRAAGDLDVTIDLVEGAVEDAIVRAAAKADVIVLAQASMAGAAGRAGVAVPVLTSPPGALRLLLQTLQG